LRCRGFLLDDAMRPGLQAQPAARFST